MTPLQASILYAVAKASLGDADGALGALIEDGFLDPDQHIESEDWKQALSDAEED